MSNERAGVCAKLWETVNAMLIITVVFSIIGYNARKIMEHQEKMAKIKHG